jgi:outer membrane protein OmpA-like peptidoglycan-associated protein
MKILFYLLSLLSFPSFSQIDSASFEAGSSFILAGVEFRVGRYSLAQPDTAAYIELNKLVDALNKRPAMIIEIIGHTDNGGNHDANVRLSWQRADMVKHFLLSHGISKKRITAIGKGGSQPLIEGNNPLNRRIEIHIVKSE